MKTTKNTGLFLFQDTVDLVNLSKLSEMEGYSFSKAFAKSPSAGAGIKQTFPGVEMVENGDEILQDGGLEMLLIACPAHDCSDLVQQAIQSGKPVRLLAEV